MRLLLSMPPGRRLAAVAAAFLLVLACKSKEAPAAGPIEVKAAPVLQKDVPIYVEAVGQTRGNTETEIRARVEGFVEKVHFQEGTMVKKGQLLYTLDPRPFQESLEKSKADLAEAQAQWARTRQDVARFEPLVKDNAVSRQEYETSVALEKAAAASVDAAKAATRLSQVELGYTKVLAPDDGLIGKSEVEAGTLVGRGLPTLLTRISKIDPIHVRFTLAEADYLHYARLRAAQGEAEKRTVPFQMVLADNSVHPYEGKFLFVDRAIDAETGTILLEASFPNPQGIVLPGQFAKVRATVETKKGALLVPQRAVQEMQGIYSVMVVKPDDTVESRAVKPGQRIGALWVIDSGLNPGDRIIVEGLQKVRPGAKVAAKMVTIEDTPPPAAPAPGA
ncbi:MAG TPA: efflux RND transporter periplasmic adaptor subunit [Candidatus Polarisedimenticolia bacterium]|nr:efflux RND transporter periplasmic adaptor subunit [Candidatus Polarisedimenticolia bacterium]